ncbi:MAG TPA: type II glyceraldehyde-3-phosphate dehydrogenase [Thermoplasmata archaeon]|jgi:glyceraldehyde-3-phosphate dehydrogenase (NAD(P))|nr:type II glyceraldehyde-3-phosphate dehydrogenase [Thermoplasmata archaeon]
MPRVRVAVNGFGTIGKRVADAVAKQPDMELVGVTKTRPNFEGTRAMEKGYPLFVAGGGDRAAFAAAGLPVAGTLDDLLGQVDVVVDAAPDKVGKENAAIYRAKGLPVVFQGGEKADVAEASFSALGNFANCLGKRSLRVVSCNTTGLARAAAVLGPHWGIGHWEATLVRRAGDPAETARGPINGILPTFQLPSHHGPDVRTIFPDLSIATTAVVVPTTLMHVHVNHVRLQRAPRDADEVLSVFRSTPRFHVFAPWEHVDGTPQVMEYARDRGIGFNDMMENVLWENGIRLDDRDLYFFQAIHQESIVVPENVDAIRAILRLAPDGATSIATTDRALGLAPTGRPSR